MTKLTLSIDEKVVERAKRYAAARGTSVSRLVETYLDAVARAKGTDDKELPPITRRLYGLLRGAKYDRKDYIDYLVRKYR